MKINKHLLISLFLIFLLHSCLQEGAQHPYLSKANALMTNHPDSALAILESIQEPQKMEKADRALYALLLTQAHDKNDIIHTNDSLIQTAVNFYTDRSNAYRKAQAYYYLGCVYEDMNNTPLSLQALLKADEALSKQYENDRLALLIKSFLASQYKEQKFYDKAMKAGRESYNNGIYRNDSADILLPLAHIGSIFLLQYENDSALHYYNKALELAEIQSDSSWIAYFSNEVSKVYYFNKDFYKANQYITKAINHERDKKNLLRLYSEKGDVLYGLQEQDSARYYLIKSLETDNIHTQYLSSLTLFEIERDAGNHKKAIEYIEIHNVASDSIYKKNKQLAIAKLLNDHAITMHTKDIHFREKRKTARIVILCTATLIALIFFFVIIDKRRKNHIIKLQKQLMRNRAETLKANQQKENTGTYNYSDQHNTLKKICIKNIQTSKELFKNNSLYKNIYAMDRLNKEVAFSSDKRDDIKDTIYNAFPDAILSLRELYNLTSDDAFCCILYALELSNRTVAACMGVAEGAIKTRKSRLKNKIDQELSTFLFS